MTGKRKERKNNQDYLQSTDIRNNSYDIFCTGKPPTPTNVLFGYSALPTSLGADGAVCSGDRVGRRPFSRRKVISTAGVANTMWDLAGLEGCNLAQAEAGHPSCIPVTPAARWGSLASPKLTHEYPRPLHGWCWSLVSLGLLVTKPSVNCVNEHRQWTQQACFPGRNSLRVRVQFTHLLPQKTSSKSTAWFCVAQPKLDLPPSELLKQINIKAWSQE